MEMKRVTVSLILIVIMAMSFVVGYSHSFNLPVYADSTTEEWQNVTTNEELAEAFRYYCKSRDLTIDGSIADGVTKFTTQTFNNIVRVLGIDVTALQANLKKSTDNNGRLQFLFNQSGISTYNRIFSQFLQDNNLAVGDSANETDNQLYSGELFSFSSGEGCLVYIVDTSANTYAYSSVLLKGTYLKYTTSQIIELANNSVTNFELSGYDSSGASTTYVCEWLKYSNGNIAFRNLRASGTQYLYSSTRNGYYSVVKNITNGQYFLCGVSHIVSNYDEYYLYTSTQIYKGSDSASNLIIFLTTNNTVINNNTYEGDTYTVINEDGDSTSSDDETPPPPSGGGGDSTTIDFPDIDFNIPDLNWSLGDLSQKFPFSIPFDLVAFYTLLNAEPVAPAIDANIPLGGFYTWRFQADFSQFDNYAVIIRNVEYIGFVVTLIYITIKFVKG